MIGSVPFELYGQWAHPSGHGVLRLEDTCLAMDLSTRNPWTWMNSPPREIRIPLKHVEALEVKSHWFLFHVWLRLRVRKLEYFVGVPTADGAEIILWCKRRCKPLAHELANAVTLCLLERVFADEEIPAAGFHTT